jgi:hypothetical protein
MSMRTDRPKSRISGQRIAKTAEGELAQVRGESIAQQRRLSRCIAETLENRLLLLGGPNHFATSDPNAIPPAKRRIRRAIDRVFGDDHRPSQTNARSATNARTRFLIDRLEDRVLLAGQPLDDTLTRYFSVNSSFSTDFTNALKSIDSNITTELGALQNIPLVGSELGKASGFLNDLSNQIQSKIAGIQSPQDVADAFNLLFGSGTTGLIKENQNLSPTYFTDMAGTMPAGPTDTAQDVLFNLDLTGTYNYSSNLDFNLGLPAIGLTTTNVSPSVSITYNFYLHFGVDDTGLYFDTNPNDGGDSTVPANTTQALNFTAKVGLEPVGTTTPPPAATFMGNLGPLTLSATDMLSPATGNPRNPYTKQLASDNPGTTGFAAKFNVTFSNSADSSNPRVYLSGGGLSNLNADYALGGTANVDLFIQLGFDGSNDLPTIDADFELNWVFGSGSNGTPVALTGSTPMSQSPTLSFKDIQLGLGTFLSGFAQNIITYAGDILQPLTPLINMLNAPAPIFNDIGFLRNLVDQNPTFGNDNGVASVGEVLALLSNEPDIATFADSAADVLNVYNELKNFVSSGNDTFINFGSFTVGSGFDLSSTSNSLSNLDFSSGSSNTTAAAPPSPLLDQLSNAIGNVGSVNDPNQGNQSSTLGTSTAQDLDGQGTGSGTDGKFDFPILDNPATIFGLLVGQNVQEFLPFARSCSPWR